MSDNDTETEYESKTEFIEAVREDGGEIDGLEYYTEGEGRSTTYYARSEDGEEEQVTKGEIEAVWDAVQNNEDDEADDVEDVDEGPKGVHLGTYYFSQSNWDEDADRETLEDILEDAGWYIDGEVDSGGYRIKAER